MRKPKPSRLGSFRERQRMLETEVPLLRLAPPDPVAQQRELEHQRRDHRDVSVKAGEFRLLKADDNGELTRAAGLFCPRWDTCRVITLPRTLGEAYDMAGEHNPLLNPSDFRFLVGAYVICSACGWKDTPRLGLGRMTLGQLYSPRQAAPDRRRWGA
jgi:hypothetical protein